MVATPPSAWRHHTQRMYAPRHHVLANHDSQEVVDICRPAARANLRVYRARFSAITSRDITRALRNLGPVDDKTVAAVDARTEIDLRLGAIFTRFQSGTLAKRLWCEESVSVSLTFLLYGCSRIGQHLCECRPHSTAAGGGGGGGHWSEKEFLGAGLKVHCPAHSSRLSLYLYLHLSISLSVPLAL